MSGDAQDTIIILLLRGVGGDQHPPGRPGNIGVVRQPKISYEDFSGFMRPVLCFIDDIFRFCPEIPNRGASEVKTVDEA